MTFMDELSETGGGKKVLRARIARRLTCRPSLAPFAVFLLIMTIATISTITVERNARADAEAHMREVSHNVSRELDQRVSSQIAFLQAGASLFTINGDVDSPAFKTFVDELLVDSEPIGAHGIGWAQVVERENLTRLEARESREATVPFAVHPNPSGAADNLTIVTYLEPETPENLSVLGFNLTSDPARKQALDMAAEMGKPVASGKLQTIYREDEQQTGFLILVPVFDGKRADKRVKGFVFCPFDTRAALDAVISVSAHREMNLRLYDGDPLPANLLASQLVGRGTGNRVREQIEVANQILTIEVESTSEFLLSNLAIERLLLGLVIATLLALLIRILILQVIDGQARLDHLAQQNSIRDSLSRELNHRVKNALSNVLSIISLTRRRSSSLDHFADSLEGRIRSLSATHDLLAHSEWSATSLRSVLEAELGTWDNRSDGAIHLSGPDTMLAPNDALSLGLAMHELATNAAKYGALSQGDGQVHVTWRLQSEDLVALEWRETGGPAVADDCEPGFGTDLIQKVVAHELKHPVDLQFNADGVRCLLRVRVRQRGEFAIRQNS